MATGKKTVIVFGATGSVGGAVCKMLKAGHLGLKDIKIVAVGNKEDACKKLESELGVHTMCKDAADAKAVKEVFDMHKDEGILGVVDTIGDYLYKPLADLSADEVMRAVSSHLPASFNVAQQAAPLLAAQGGGSIVCVGAAVVRHGMKHHEAFAAAKGAVEALYRNAAATYAPKHVRINCVAPGLIHVEDASSAGAGGGGGGAQQHDAAMEKESAQLYPMKRIATPEDVAHAVTFLLHPMTSFTTGAALPVDGGLTTVQAHGLVHQQKA